MRRGERWGTLSEFFLLSNVTIVSEESRKRWVTFAGALAGAGGGAGGLDTVEVGPGVGASTGAATGTGATTGTGAPTGTGTGGEMGAIVGATARLAMIIERANLCCK